MTRPQENNYVCRQLRQVNIFLSCTRGVDYAKLGAQSIHPSEYATIARNSGVFWRATGVDSLWLKTALLFFRG